MQVPRSTGMCESGIPWVSLRPNAFMQNTINDFADSIRRHNCFRAPQGGGRVSAQLSELLGRPPITFQQFATDHADAFR